MAKLSQDDARHVSQAVKHAKLIEASRKMASSVIRLDVKGIRV